MSTISQCQTPATASSPLCEHRDTPVERITDSLETPSLDDRLYRVIKLPNQLEVLLVQDAETDKASAAMDVNVGNFNDPEQLPGLAHCVEHMLFMGTKKYPAENAYAQYLSANSGYSHAYTATTSTNYYFEVAAKPAEDVSNSGTVLSPLYGALDRFSQFFIEPLFLSETLDRELRAVDSENKKNLQNDQWRLHQLDKSLSNPNHPYCHFSTGNLETLIPEAQGIDVRKAFMDFHEKYYSANRMKLVVVGRESLNTLEEWVVDLFSNVKYKGKPQIKWEGEQPFRKQELLTQYFAKPVMETRLLDLNFPISDEEYLYESQPSRYLSHLISHEGPGSIMSYIKTEKDETPYPVFLGLRTKDGINESLILSEPESDFELPSLDFVKLNADHTSIYRTFYTPERLEKFRNAAKDGLLSVVDCAGILADAGVVGDGLEGFLREPVNPKAHKAGWEFPDSDDHVQQFKTVVNQPTEPQHETKKAYPGLSYLIRQIRSLSPWSLAIWFASPALADVHGIQSSDHDHKDHFVTEMLRAASYPILAASVAIAIRILAKVAGRRYGPREESVYHHVQLFASGIICFQAFTNPDATLLEIATDTALVIWSLIQDRVHKFRVGLRGNERRHLIVELALAIGFAYFLTTKSRFNFGQALLLTLCIVTCSYEWLAREWQFAGVPFPNELPH